MEEKTLKQTAPIQEPDRKILSAQKDSDEPDESEHEESEHEDESEHEEKEPDDAPCIERELRQILGHEFYVRVTNPNEVELQSVHDDVRIRVRAYGGCPVGSMKHLQFHEEVYRMSLESCDRLTHAIAFFATPPEAKTLESMPHPRVKSIWVKGGNIEDLIDPIRSCLPSQSYPKRRKRVVSRRK